MGYYTYAWVTVTENSVNNMNIIDIRDNNTTDIIYRILLIIHTKIRIKEEMKKTDGIQILRIAAKMRNKNMVPSKQVWWQYVINIFFCISLLK